MSAATEIPVCPARREESRAPPAARTLVLGLGNPLLADDSVGLRVAGRLRSLLVARPDVEIAEDYWGGLRLMERLVGFERAVIIDAQRSGAAPGAVSVLSPHARPTQHGASAHDADLLTALELGRQAGAALPATDDIRIVAVEAADVETFCEDCTPAVAASIPIAAQTVLAILEAWR